MLDGGFLRVFGASVRIAAADLRAVYTPRSWLFGWLLRVTSQVTFFALIGALVGSRAQTEFLLVGTSALAVAMANMNAVASTTWERRAGTLGLLVAAPSSAIPVFFGRSAQWVADGLTTGWLSLVLVGVIFGFAWSPVEMVAAFLLMAVASISSYVFALSLAAVVLRSPGMRTFVGSLGYLSLAALCGIVVPTDSYPAPMPQLAAVIPLTHAVDALRGLLSGGDVAIVLRALLLQLLTTIAWFFLAVFAFQRFLERARRSGTLEFG